MIGENLETIKAQIQSKGVKLSSIHLVGVTKFQPVEKVKEVLREGVKDLAVNYAQEGEALRKELSSLEPVRWHFIGHIQSRKMKYLPAYDLLQSLDRLDIAPSLNALLEGKKKKMEVLVEINIGEELGKSGISAEELPSFLEQIAAYPNLVVKGLMAMPPLGENPESGRRYFQQMRRLYEIYEKPSSFQYLSMGTSFDYLVAIDEGANMVRLGTCLFGERTS